MDSVLTPKKGETRVNIAQWLQETEGKIELEFEGEWLVTATMGAFSAVEKSSERDPVYAVRRAILKVESSTRYGW